MNKHFFPIAMASALLAAGSSCGSRQEEANEKIIEKPDNVKIENRHYSVDVLEAFGRVTEPQVSPDGKKILFGIAYESVEQNKSNRDLYLMDSNGANLSRLTRTAKSENAAVWFNGGNQIAFISSENGTPQIWVMNADGSDRKCVSDIENGVDGFKFSPDEKKVVIISQVKYSRTAKDVYPDLPDATGRIIDDLMYKHWDEWTVTIPHPFIADFNGSKIENVEDIMQDEPYEAPMKPFGGIESLAWSPDSKSLVYVSRKKTGMDYAFSTNSDLYLYNIESKETRNLTPSMMGYDTAPSFSPSGELLAWLSMEHDGYESDKNRLMVMDMKTGEITDLTADWDYSLDSFCWNPDEKSLYFIAPYLGTMPVFSIDLASHEVNQIAGGEFDYASLAPVGSDKLITMRHCFTQPNEIMEVTGENVKQLTEINSELIAAVDMPSVERRMVKTTDGKEMLTWIVKPADFDSTKAYPAILYCQGGPQQAVSQFFSYRWNLALMAAQGYVVIAPNRRGLPGFGTEWNAQISKDYGGQNMKDYLAAVDDVKKEAWIDETKIGAVGASYGGFSVYWLAGHHENRFACLIAHAGIFNMESQYLETEEMWFAEWDMGGSPWSADKFAKATFATSPHKFVDKWTAPILITHGEYDFRILSSQGQMAFNAARMRGIPAEMLIFPDENHWILKPQNAVLWQRVFFRWLDKWLKDVDYQNPPLYDPENK